MKKIALSIAFTAVLLTGLTAQDVLAQRSANSQRQESSQMTLTFDGKRYLHRYSKNGQYEFTPPGQENLQQWKDMITLVFLPGADAAKTLQWAEGMAAGFKERGILVHADQPPGGEYRMLGALRGPGLVEVNFVRMMPHESGALAFMVQRRFYGEESTQMADWVRDNSPRISEQLMTWQPPSASAIVALPESP